MSGAVTPSATHAAVTLAAPDEATVLRLLASYRDLLDEVERARWRAPLPRRMWAWPTTRASVEYIRKSLAILDRRFAAQAALAAQPDESAARARERVEQFAASLPPPASRLRPLWMAAAVLVIAQLLLPLVRKVGQGLVPTTSEGADRVSELGKTLTKITHLKPNDVGDALDIVLNTNLLVTSLILVAVGVAAYLVLRPLANGAIGLRLLRHGETSGRWPPFHASERRTGARLGIRQREAEVFDAAGLDSPPDSPIDLVAKALLVAPLLLVAAAFWDVFLAHASYQISEGLSPPGQPGSYGSVLVHVGAPKHARIAVATAVVGTWRLAWLILEARRRDSARRPGGASSRARASWVTGGRLGMSLALSLCVTAAGLGVYALWDHRPPDVWLAARDVAAAQLEKKTLQLSYSCDEPCTTDSTRLIAEFGAPRPPTYDGQKPSPGYPPGWTHFLEHNQDVPRLSKKRASRPFSNVRPPTPTTTIGVPSSRSRGSSSTCRETKLNGCVTRCADLSHPLRYAR